MSRFCLTLAALCLLAPQGRAADAGADLGVRTAASLYDGIVTATLPNGLRVYLKPIPGSTSVTTMVVYKVGSADEDKTFTGLSHYLEHLMFKGTATLKPGDVDRITFRAGGQNNAYTSNDVTAYHFTLPAGRWKPVLEVEADRMRNIRIDKEHEFDREKGAVISELAGNEDSPWDLEYKAMLPVLYGKGHPYGHPVIGEREHVRDATEKVIKAHYDKWYHPNNASLVMVGGFDADEAMKEIKRLFSPIPKAELPARKKIPETPVKLPARTEMKSKFTVPRLLIAYPTVTLSHKDRPALDVLESVLSRGKLSRLYKSLVEDKLLLASIQADHSPGAYGGFLGVFADVYPDKDRAAVEKAVLAELAALRDKDVTDAELARVKKQILAATVFGRESTYALADSIGRAVSLTSLEEQKKYLPAVLAVTAEDVRRVAKEYLDPAKSVTLWSLPADKDKMGAAPRDKAAKVNLPTRLNRAPEAKGAFDLSKTKRVVLDNGLVVLLFANPRLPIVEAHASLREAALYQADDKLGVASLTASLLDEGSTKRTGAEISQAIEGVGGVLSLGSGSGSVKVLSPDRKLGLGVLLECVTSPAFKKEPFDRIREQTLSDLAEAEVTPSSRAAKAYMKAVYGAHPLGRDNGGTVASVKGLTPADCAAFHKTVFVPNNTILAVVGDFDADAVVAEIKALTADWKKSDLPTLKLPEVDKPKAFTDVIISMPEAAQVAALMGHVGISRKDADYYKLLVMDYILGTGPGFTDRISARLRDREGLAYSVSAAITNSAGLHPGAFTCRIGTENVKLARAKELFLEELNKVRDTKPTEVELTDARNYLVGSQTLTFGTSGGIAGQLLAIEKYGLGFDYLETFKKNVEAVTAEDVQAVAKKHIDPKRMVFVAAGALDKAGKPLKGGK